MITAAGGVSVAADIYGDFGPLVILQHGGGQTRHAWKSAGQSLADAGYQAVSLDARGHGDSEWAPNGDYSNDVLVDDLVAVVEHFDQAPLPLREELAHWLTVSTESPLTTATEEQVAGTHRKFLNSPEKMNSMQCSWCHCDLYVTRP